jgi:hypothetical protein
MTSRKDHTERTDANAAATAPKAAEHADPRSGECQRLEQDLRDAGTRLLDSTKGLREELARQAQLHPLATFGAAFAAGVLLARALRR